MKLYLIYFRINEMALRAPLILTGAVLQRQSILDVHTPFIPPSEGFLRWGELLNSTSLNIVNFITFITLSSNHLDIIIKSIYCLTN